MAMHMNDWGLKSKLGYNLVAAYDLFDKWYYSDYEKRWRYNRTTVKCYKNETHFLVRLLTRTYTWDLVYNTAEEANAKVKSLFESCDFHKKTL